VADSIRNDSTDRGGCPIGIFTCKVLFANGLLVIQTRRVTKKMGWKVTIAKTRSKTRCGASESRGLARVVELVMAAFVALTGGDAGLRGCAASPKLAGYAPGQRKGERRN